MKIAVPTMSYDLFDVLAELIPDADMYFTLGSKMYHQQQKCKPPEARKAFQLVSDMIKRYAEKQRTECKWANNPDLLADQMLRTANKFYGGIRIEFMKNEYGYPQIEMTFDLSDDWTSFSIYRIQYSWHRNPHYEDEDNLGYCICNDSRSKTSDRLWPCTLPIGKAAIPNLSIVQKLIELSTEK